MQKAIENYVNIQLGDMVPIKKVKAEVDKVAEAVIEKARRKQLILWRKKEYGR